METKSLISSFPASSKATFFALRLLPGTELLESLRNFIAEHKIRAGFIASVVGSLSLVSLRFAGRPHATTLTGDTFEVIALSGTLDQEGEHLHMSVADCEGRMIGGHVMPGCTVRTTLELVIGELGGLEFTREPCPLSTYDELVVRVRNNSEQ